MARKKQANPLQRLPSSDIMQEPPDAPISKEHFVNGSADGFASTISRSVHEIPQILSQTVPDAPGYTQLIICVAGIYTSFLSWAFLQERITTTTYGSTEDPRKWSYAIVLNTIQSFFAMTIGYLYLLATKRGSTIPPIFPTRSIFPPLILVAITSSLASPFGYASLAHIDYITYLLAKSCKLVPLMLLHVTLFQRRYPVYKYAVVAAVTAGVAIFTLHHPSSSKKRSTSGNSAYGLSLLSINLLFDGLMNSTQDHIFSNFRPYSGPQMMVALNTISTVLTGIYLLVMPYIPPAITSAFVSDPNELSSALSFLHTHPKVLNDVLAFSACGAIGQIFIFHTLSKFSSLLLVTVNVTRKMLSMVVSVVMFGHTLTGMQWVGVGLVFGGVGGEAYVGKKEKDKKREKKENGKAG